MMTALRPSPSGARGGVESLDAILKRWLCSQRVKERAGESGIFGAWKEVVGADLATRTRVVSLAGGTLIVEVASAPLLNELSTYRREEILDSLRSRPGLTGVRQIRFRAGSR